MSMDISIGEVNKVEEMPHYDLEPIPQDQLLARIGFDSDVLPQELRNSVSNNTWYSAAEGRILVEVRNPDKLATSKDGMLYISDLDDTLMASTEWHEEEYRLVSESPELKARGVDISYQQAKDIYARSKLTPPGIMEPRYTPQVNLILASTYAKALEQGLPQTEAWQKMHDQSEEIKTRLATEPESIIGEYELDQDIAKSLMENHTKEYVFKDFAEDFISGSDPNDIRVIATRGKVEGALGQIHKAHSTGLLDQDPGVDIVMYTNDLKADAIPVLYQLAPQTKDRGTRFYDDNPSEINRYLDWAKKHGVHNLEIIGVRHPTAKRKDDKAHTEPIDSTGEAPDTIYDVYYASSDVPLRDVEVTG